MSGFPDDLIVLDPDDPQFGSGRHVYPLRVIERGTCSGEVAPEQTDGAAVACGPSEHSTPNAATQAHTRDIAPGSFPRVPAAEKIAHEAHEPPTLASPFVGDGVDPAVGSPSLPGVIHHTSDSAEHELHSVSAERITSGFERQETIGNAVLPLSARCEKAADDAAGTLIASDQIQPVFALLNRLAERSGAALASAVNLRDYLDGLSLNVPVLVTRMRLGATSPTLAEGLTTDDLGQLAQVGLVHGLHRTLTLTGERSLLLWTVDPRHPDQVVGVIRLSPAQHKHEFASTPAGIACARDLGDPARVILTDAPLLGLRLIHAGVAGVLIVEDPAVLLPLHGWLAGRVILIAGWRADERAAIRAGLGPLAGSVEEIQVDRELKRLSPAVAERLGITVRAFHVIDTPPPPITAHLLRDLHTAAVAALQRGEGVAACAAFGLTDPTLVTAWKIGYLPSTIRRALPPAHRRCFAGIPLGNTLIVPAFGTAGVVVDLLIAEPEPGGKVIPTLFDTPRGLIGAAVVTAFPDLIVTDSLRRAARYAAAGHQNLILLRDATDAAQNLPRLIAAGVEHVEVRCWRGGDAIAAVLRDGGIRVTQHANQRVASQSNEPEVELPAESPAPSTAITASSPAQHPDIASPVAAPATASVTLTEPMVVIAADTPVLLDHDVQAERAVFTAGDIGYELMVPWDERTTVTLRITHGEHHHRGEVDLALDVQRRRFAAVAGAALHVPATRIVAHLIVLHARLAELKTTAAGEAAPKPLAIAPGDRAVLDLLISNDLIARVLAALADLGWPASDDLRLFGFLAVLSRRLDRPAWIVFTATDPIHTAAALTALATAVPPEERLQATKLTDNALLHADPTALQHRALILDDVAQLSAGVAMSLRTLHARGAVSGTLVERDALAGGVRTRFVEARGPVAVLAAASDGIDPRLASCLIEVPLDESTVILDQPIAVGIGASKRVAAATHLLHALQRLLPTRPVVLPSSVSAVPGGSPRSRLQHQTVLALAAASALLHQHQREIRDGAIIATTDDLALADRLSACWAQPTEGGLTRTAAALLTALRRAARTRCTMEDCTLLLPAASRSGLVRALAELTKTEFLASPTGGRGKQRLYRLLTNRTNRYVEDEADRKVDQLTSQRRTSGQLTTPDARVG